MLGDMKIIYADSLVLLNAAVDYVLLLCAGKLCALPLRRWRMALGALLGGGYALLCAVRPGFWTLWTVKLAAGAVMVLLAYGLDRRTPRALAAFYAAAAAFGGAARFAASLRGEPAGLGNPISARVLGLSFAVCYAAVALIFRCVGARQGERLHDVTLTRRGRTLTLRALEDSGNALTDPLTGDAVLVASAAALAPLFDDPACLTLDAPEALAKLSGEQGRGLRLLPCACVTAQRGLLLCFRPDSIEVDGKARRDLLVAVSPHRLSPEGRYDCIIRT
jgi:stage II sporulation protein GA (sporulation sigma-E factor processing peptidase)